MSEQFLRGEGVFEITDHTTASDWERFISSTEEVLTEFNITKQSEVVLPAKELPEGFISSGLWHEKHDTVRFGNVTFEIRYQYLDDSSLGRENDSSKLGKQDDEDNKSSRSGSLDWQYAENEDADNSNNEVLIDEKKEHGEHEVPEDLPECLVDLISTTNDFASKAHCLVRWYNFRRFIVLIPKGDTIMSEDRIKLVLSSASIALANVDCQVPIFVQTHNSKNHFYQGISEHSNIRTMYEMVFMKQSLKQYQHLSDMINLFREKISCNLTDPISVTIRMNYLLDFFDLFNEPHEEFSGVEYESDQDDLVKMTRDKKKKPASKDIKIQDMRSGATFEQVQDAMDKVLPHPYKILRCIHVAALWPPASDKVITDSPVHSDLDPVEAPIWTMRCVTSDNCNMKIVHEAQVVNDLLQAAIRYAYDKLNASEVFTDCDRAELESSCLKLSYELATKPEVVISRSPTDSIRKLIALMFHRSSELRADLDDLEQAVAHLRKRYTLGEIYRDFKRQKASVKEFIIRTQISRPFGPISTPALPQRMFCTIAKEEFRLCGAFSELCN